MPRWGDMLALFGDAPVWIGLIAIFVAIAYTVCMFGVVFGKMGRSPYWGLVFIVPFLGTVMLWVFGLGRWPQPARNVEMESGL